MKDELMHLVRNYAATYAAVELAYARDASSDTCRRANDKHREARAAVEREIDKLALMAEERNHLLSIRAHLMRSEILWRAEIATLSRLIGDAS